MLAGKERRGNHYGDLHAVHGRDEGGAQCHLRLAETDVAADEPVHRPAGGEVGEDVLDGAELVRGFREGKAGDEALVLRPRWYELRRGFRLPLPRERDEAAGGLVDLAFD